ncbi:type VI secretion system Vgr family protein [Escherichia coli]|uniref:type VI secretion system Vgr family protein n=1 Tax=Escherichia coli TaxID=562 RepID=UPI000FFC7C23|nr:type VI secretion system Vgr family protein [Escherichia coli]EFF9449130.1 type VI secretion system tip protein VgrG [Escherichia coli]RXB85335.1 type VI secretion system tip protein VgrG [Escherichia coli]
MDNRSAFFDGQTRYFLEINGSAVKPDVLRFRGREALSEPFRWDIGFTSRNTNIPPEEVLMKYASLRMRNDKNVHGIVTRLEWLSTSKDQSHYRLTLSSRLALLEHTRQCAVFQNQSVPEVVEQVLRKHGLEGADFEFRLERAYPSREIITQWQETDLQFIQRILSEVGIYWRTEMDDVRGLDTYIFADSQLHYQFDVQLPYSEPSGLFDGAAESVWDVRTWHNVATGTVTTRDYNYRTATTPMNATVSVRNDAVTTGEHYRYAAPYREAGDDASPEPETESGAFYARLHHERELNRSARIHLFSNAAHLSPGQVLEPQGDVITDLKEGIVLTLVTYRGARDTRLHVSARGMPYTERYCFRPAEIPRPVIPGTLPARIESREKNDIYAHLDDQGRYRVKMDFDREGTEPGFGYLWLRMAKSCAGETLGWHTPLIDGTEVAIAYSNGDIDLPYIAYALHGAEHPDPVNRDNHTRNILRTPANSKLRMEDRRGEEHIKLATEYGKTQLNSGHLVDSQGQLRGKGTELRTDEWGTLRAGKGLFVAADVQAKAQGEALDMDAALKEIDRLNQQLQQLENAAERAQALKADIDSQIQMFEQRLKLLNEAVLFSAPEGMALTSGEDMQMSAARNVAVNAGGDISTGTMGNLTALAGEKLGLFARTGQLSVKSGEGPVEVQVQNGSMRLFAEKKLTLSSASDISFAGKKRITLIGGGSYLRLEAGKVEYGTTASYMRKVKWTMAAAAMSIEPPMIKGSEVPSDLAGQDKLLDSVCKPDDVVGVVESFFSDDPVQLDSVQRKRNAAEEIIKNGTLLLGEDHQHPDSRVVLLDLIAGGKINKLLLEIPDCNLRNRFVGMKGKPPENSAEWAATKDLIDILAGCSETENRVKMSDLIHSALAEGIDVYPMDLACGVGGYRQAMRRRNIHMGDVYKKVATANEPGVAILVGDDHLKTYPAQAASGVMRGQQEVPSLTDCCSLSPGQVLRLDGGEI